MPQDNSTPKFEIGQEFGRWTVLRFLEIRISSGKEHRPVQYWVCKCKCGTERPVSHRSLQKNGSTSCGCLNLENKTKASTTHGMTLRSEYYIRRSMLARCYNSRRKDYKNYGGRGVTVCKEWRDSFENFFRDMGPRPGPRYSLERKENNKGYEPGNVVWATIEDQARNRRNSHWLEFEGRKQVIEDWAKEYGMNSATLYNRLNRGWSMESALKTPIRTRLRSSASHDL